MCQEQYGLTPNYNYTLDHYGGVRDSEMLGYSNIFFSNGKLDPWRYNVFSNKSGASPLYSLSDTLPAVYMDDCSHHLDLRPPNSKDPKSVIIGRQMEIDFLSRLIKNKNDL